MTQSVPKGRRSSHRSAPARHHVVHMTLLSAGAPHHRARLQARLSAPNDGWRRLSMHRGAFRTSCFRQSASEKLLRYPRRGLLARNGMGSAAREDFGDAMRKVGDTDRSGRSVLWMRRWRSAVSRPRLCLCMTACRSTNAEVSTPRGAEGLLASQLGLCTDESKRRGLQKRSKGAMRRFRAIGVCLNGSLCPSYSVQSQQAKQDIEHWY